MIRRMTMTAALVAAGLSFASAQDSTSSSALQISGSVDAYYKYDFAGLKGGTGNIPTSFASDNNSVSLGMIDIALKKSTGKASFVGEIAFGPRGQYQSVPNGDGTDLNSFHIQNLHATYAFTDQFSMTAGYMGTFVGYEVISPVGNYNYSTSYLFTNGPFQNAGIKGTYAFSSKASLMVGLFNDWNAYKDINGVSHVGAQLMIAPVEGWTAYLNFLSGYSAGAPGNGTIYDLTTAYQISKGFKLGLNAADYEVDKKGGGYTGVALYPQFAITEGFGLGLRGEYFMFKERTDAVTAIVTPETSVTALTLSANLKAGGLTVIPEFRLDNGKDDMFLKGKSSLAADTKSASQFTLGVVYAF